MGTDENSPSGITGGDDQSEKASGAGAASDQPEPPELRDPKTRVIWEAEYAARIAEANKLVTLMKYIDSQTDETRREVRADYESLQAREASPEALRLCAQQSENAVRTAEDAAIMCAADALNLSEHHVTSLHIAAESARTQLPKVWQAFREGRITCGALRSIAGTLNKPLKEGTIEKLDEKAPAYAETHRPGQLHDWLRRFIAKVEPIGAAERFTRAAKERHVTVRDLDDGMSLLTAIMPTMTAHSIQQKLEAVARSPQQAIPHNPLIATQIDQQEQRLELTRALNQWMHAGRRSEGSEVTLIDSWEIGQAAQHMAQELQEENLNAQQVPFADGLHITDGAPIGLSEAPGPNERPREMNTDAQAAGHLPETRADGDPRNISQRALDMFTAWLLDGGSSNGIEIETHIGILVPEATLKGTSDQPAISRDGRAVIPGPHIRDMLRIQHDNLKWCELGTNGEPPGSAESPSDAKAHGEDILSYHSVGRYPPPRLRTALQFRDGVCVADGCRTPAERCDIDHIVPWPHGGTHAENLQVLCRRHHRLKTAGYDIKSHYTQAA